MYQRCAKCICDETTAISVDLSKNSFLDVETAFCYTFSSSNLRCLPPTIPEFVAHYMGIRVLVTHSIWYQANV